MPGENPNDKTYLLRYSDTGAPYVDPVRHTTDLTLDVAMNIAAREPVTVYDRCE